VEQFLLSLFESTSGGFAYAVVFGILILCGLGVPVPEDVSLILGGFLVYEGKADLVMMMLTGYLGIILGDSLVFFAGRRIGSKVGTSGGFFARIVTPERRVRVEGLFAKHGEKIVMIARFMPGVRAVTYFTAGSAKMKYWHFVLFDSVAALVSAPVFIYLGYYFGGELESLIRAVRNGQIRVLVGVLVVIAAYVLGSRLFNRWRAKKNPPAAAPVASPESSQAPIATPGRSPERIP
jgi:membrane protein DedA with SNARE-associated domain